jgi:hypothetical protein
MARWSRQSDRPPGATLKVHRLLRRSRDDSPWTDRRKVISATRAADGTETFEFEQAHNLCAGERIKMVGTTGGSGLTGIKTIASIVNETTITVAGSRRSGGAHCAGQRLCGPLHLGACRAAAAAASLR